MARTRVVVPPFDSAAMLTVSGTPEAPLYCTLRDAIRSMITNNRLKAGDRIPSERELTAAFQVSRSTVREAIDLLVREGVLERRHSSGTFVARPKIEQGLLRLVSFTEDMLRKGLMPSSRLLGKSIVPAPPFVARALALEAGEPVSFFRRLRLVDGEPLVLESSYFPQRLFPDLLDEYTGDVPLYDVIASRYGARVVKALETFEPVIIRGHEAELLGTQPHSPGLLIEQVNLAEGGVRMELCVGLVRGDRCRYYVELIRE
jgi:GntR family transcriptional regulator